MVSIVVESLFRRYILGEVLKFSTKRRIRVYLKVVVTSRPNGANFAVQTEITRKTLKQEKKNNKELKLVY